jgi:hypothetical protein
MVAKGRTATEPDLIPRESTLLPDEEGLFQDTIVWYTNDAHTIAWDFNNPVTENLNLYAQWTDPVLVDLSEETGDHALAKALNHIQNTPAVTASYTIVLDSLAETYTMPGVSLSSANINTPNAVITLAGKNATEISLSGSGSLFYITAGKLVLDKNITLKGLSSNDSSLVYVNGASAFLQMKADAKITGNSAGESGGGGVQVNNGGSFTMSGGEISGNSARGGGGVFVDGSFTMSGGAKITGNTGGSGGGSGVFIMSGSFTLEDGEISDNDAHLYGGVYVGSDSSFTMRDGEISGNSAEVGGGGGVYVDNGGSFALEGGVITGNNTGTMTNAHGGGVWVAGGSSFIMSGGEISGNTAAFYGGGVYTEGSFTMSGGEIFGNNAKRVENNVDVYGTGGGVSVGAGSFTLQDAGKISGNTALSGGGVYVIAGGFTMSGGEISGNNTTATGGGGVSVNNSGSFTLEGGKITGNNAFKYGGGVYVYGGGSFDMDGGEISGNNTGENSSGGGVYVSGSFTMRGGVISGHTTPIYGGGVYVVGSFDMSGGEISGNTATWYGGGLCVNGSFDMSSGVISGNNAYGGGGVFVNSGGSFSKTGSGTIIYGSDEEDSSLKNTASVGNTWGHSVYYAASDGVYYRDYGLNVGDNINTNDKAANWTKKP